MAKDNIYIPEVDIPLDIIAILLRDHTTGKNIIWATDDYSSRGDGYQFFDEITLDSVTGFNANLVRPRVSKSRDEQRGRSREKAEVFTPAWVCNAQNNLIDEAWFKRSNVFNIESNDESHTWTPTGEVKEFPKNKTWKKYVKAQRLEMACGEAPYLCSRYDAATGEFIEDVNMRVGMLDRKMRIVKENALEQPSDPPAQWRNWSALAYKSIYGFDYQGDSLFIARKTLLLTYIDYFIDRWGYAPNRMLLKTIADIISWNLWQMDGFTYGIPGYTPNHESDKPEEHFCCIMDWDMKYRKDGGVEVLFKDLIK